MSATTKRLIIGGMTCPYCQARVQQALLGVPGVARAQVSYDRGTADVTLDPEEATLATLCAAIEGAGYRLLDAPERTSLLRAAGYLLLMAALFMLLQATVLLNRLAPGQLAQSGMGYGMLFLVGLMTSVHCVAMCGGISLSQSLPGGQAQAKSSTRQVLTPALLYNAGRVISYTLTGLIFGTLGMLFGAGLDTSLSVLAQAALKVVAGLLMLAMGLSLLGLFPALRRLRLRLPRLPKRLRPRGPLTVGLLNGLMPCGPLQAMQLAVLSSASPVRGALSMLAFSLGTVPLMLCIGLIGGKLNQRFARPMRIVSAILVVLMGMSMLVSGLALAGVGVAATPMGEDGVAAVQYGVQYVYSEIDYGSYPAITVQTGVPVEWTIHAEEGKLTGCNNEIVIPAYGLTVPLQPGDNLVEFTPTQTGVIPYTCWMGMIRSSIYVVDSLEDADAVQSLEAAAAALNGATATTNTGGSCCDPVTSTGTATYVSGSCCDPVTSTGTTTYVSGSCCDPAPVATEAPSYPVAGYSCCY